jgi:predicted DNA-binding ribbon-helix-helix protein
MAAVSLRLPESIYQSAKELSAEDKISLNQFIATAVAEKVASLNTESYLKQRALRGSKEKFLQALSKVPDVEPEPKDRL